MVKMHGRTILEQFSGKSPKESTLLQLVGFSSGAVQALQGKDLQRYWTASESIKKEACHPNTQAKDTIHKEVPCGHLLHSMGRSMRVPLNK